MAALTVPVASLAELSGLEEGSDAWCVAFWLHATASNSPHTLRAYRREALRWLAFLAALRGVQPPSPRLLSTATYEDAQRFIEWVKGAGPDLPRWAYAAFPGKLSRPSATDAVLRQAVVVLHGMYSELVGTVAGQPPRSVVPLNPFQPWRRRRHRGELAGGSAAKSADASGVAKALSDDAWRYLWEAACVGVEQAVRPAQRRLAARRRLGLALLRGTWERRSAVAGLCWGDLQRTRDGAWKVHVQRKGAGGVWVNIPEELLAELDLFRCAVGLSPLPFHPDEKVHSVFWCGGEVGRCGPISDDTLWRDMRALFAVAAQAATQDGQEMVAAELSRAGAGPHTIRHTMATMFMAAGGDARRAQAILGHSSLAVTTKTYDSKRDAEVVAALDQQWQRSDVGN